jgi:ABC-2 type transport system permease protein
MLGLLLRSEKAVMSASYLLFPVTFLSNVFVEPKTMPGWLQVVVKVNPISHVVTSLRGLMAGTGAGSEILWVVGWGAAFMVVFGALTMRLYNRI